MPISDLREDLPRLGGRGLANVECVGCGADVSGNRVNGYVELRPAEIVELIKETIRSGRRWRDFQIIAPKIEPTISSFPSDPYPTVTYTFFDMGKWISDMQREREEFDPEFDAGEMTVHGNIGSYLRDDRYQGNLAGVRMFLCSLCRGDCRVCHGPTNDRYLDPVVRGWDMDGQPGICGNSSCIDESCECESCGGFFIDGDAGNMNQDYMDSDGDINGRNWCSRCSAGWEWCDEHECYEHPSHVVSCSNEDVIGGWRSNPTFVFHGFSKLGSVIKNGYVDPNFPNQVYLGMELECAPGSGTKRNTGAKFIHSAYKDRLWLKTDGSVSDGMEICTHPMTLEYFRSLDWRKLEELLGMGWLAWDDDRCGIHVHVGRNAFVNDSHLWKFAEMIVGNPRQVQKFAGRGSGTYHNYIGLKKGASEVIARGKDVSSERFRSKTMNSYYFIPEHYQAVNLANAHTVEVRIFRSTLKVRRILANLEFVDACVEYTRGITAGDCLKDKALSWQKFFEWLDGKDKYLELRSFFKKGGEEYIPIEPRAAKAKVSGKKVTRRVLVAS